MQYTCSQPLTNLSAHSLMFPTFIPTNVINFSIIDSRYIAELVRQLKPSISPPIHFQHPFVKKIKICFKPVSLLNA